MLCGHNSPSAVKACCVLRMLWDVLSIRCLPLSSSLLGHSHFQPLVGERPPLDEADWQAEFAKYQQSPEFRKLNSKMTLREFKFIYWMEYAHRMWGRALGLVFAAPCVYFASRGLIRGQLSARMLVLISMGAMQARTQQIGLSFAVCRHKFSFTQVPCMRHSPTLSCRIVAASRDSQFGIALRAPVFLYAHESCLLSDATRFHCLTGCLQGFVGWWMVRSGLREPQNDHSVPRVSPYRLALHLTSAFVIYSTLIWTTLSLADAQPLLLTATKSQQLGGKWLRGRMLPISVLLGVTAVSGALVSVQSDYVV